LSFEQAPAITNATKRIDNIAILLMIAEVYWFADLFWILNKKPSFEHAQMSAPF
jgi:hypothetical protein